MLQAPAGTRICILRERIQRALFRRPQKLNRRKTNQQEEKKSSKMAEDFKCRAERKEPDSALGRGSVSWSAAASCPRSCQVQTEVRPVSRPAPCASLGLGANGWGVFFFLPYVHFHTLIVHPNFFRGKKTSVSLKKRHSVLQNPAASLAAREAGWHYTLI